MSDYERSGREGEGEVEEPQIQRIVVALDASPQSAILLEAAARLAQSLQVELVGLFVEDANLLRLSELPFAQEIGSFSTARRSLGAMYLERQLRSQAMQLQRMLVRTAARFEVPCSFQVVRGPIAAELRKAAAETDLFVLGRSGRTHRGHFPLGSTTRALIVEAPRLTLVLHQPAQWRQPILVAYDGSAAAQRALYLAARLTQDRDVPLVVVLIGDEPHAAEELRHAVANWLHNRGLRARYQWLARANIARMVNLVMMEQGGAFVLPVTGMKLQEAALLSVLDELQCPVLLVQ